MHELAICQAMIEQVEDIALQQHAHLITRIKVQIGPLSGVEAKLLKQAFPIASAGSIAEDAVLVMEELPIRVRCETCNAETNAQVNRLLCGNCGDYHTRLLSGDELLLASVEMEKGPEKQIRSNPGVTTHV